jgi:hypothetical protein
VSHVIQTYTHPVSVPSMTRAASRSASFVGMSSVATCTPTAAAQGTRVSAFDTALGYRKAIALIPNSDVVTDGTPGFRTWSPPV